MKKHLLIGCFLCCLLSARAQDIPTWKVTDLEAYINRHPNKTIIINMWATFCKPCVAEIPHFQKIARQYDTATVSLLLVSLDLPSQYPHKIRAFAKKHGFDARMAWLDETNADYFCPKLDPSWSGSIPATLIVHNGNGYRKFVEGEMSEADFKEAVEASLRKGK